MSLRALNLFLALCATAIVACTCLNKKIDDFQKNFSGPQGAPLKGEPEASPPRVGKRP